MKQSNALIQTGEQWIGSVTAKEDLGVIMDHKINTSQLPAVAKKKPIAHWVALAEVLLAGQGN